MTSSTPDPELQTIAAYDARPAAYALHSEDRRPLNRLHARFVDLVGPGAAVADLGCGPGHDAAALAARGLTPTGIDPSHGLLLEARRHEELAGALVQADARRLPFAGDSFDGIWACASLLHVPKRDIGRALTEMYRILRPGGILFTSMSEGGQPGPIHVESDGLAQRLYYYHGEEAWASLVAAPGFVLVDHAVNRWSGHFNPGSSGWIETFARKP
jgi:ubiquinone/menaquinone biosynthesis C-methylase UbiE